MVLRNLVLLALSICGAVGVNVEKLRGRFGHFLRYKTFMLD